MITYKQFTNNTFLIFEDKLEDTYWFKLSYQELIYLIKHNILKINNTLTVVSRNSKNSNKYNDIYKYPVTIYCDENKFLEFLKSKNYKTSLSKDNIFLESVDSPEMEPDDLLSDEEIQDNTTTDTEEPDISNDTDTQNSTDEIPDEFDINEDNIEIPNNVILGIEVNLKKMTNLLDSDLINIAKMLDINGNKLRNKTDQNARDEVKKCFDDKLTEYCKKNNISKNLIED